MTFGKTKFEHLIERRRENEIRTCNDCKHFIPINERHLEPIYSICKVAACLKIVKACEDFKPKERVNKNVNL